MNVMIDLETFGTGPNAAIVALGAVTEDGRTFYTSIYPEGDFDADTVLWWLQQSEDARRPISTPSSMLESVLRDFAEWLPSKAKVWGNGSDFDNVILDSAYKRKGLPLPWKYYDNRCYRTLKKMFPHIKPPSENKCKHSALSDAIYQMNHLKEILKHVG